MAQSVSEDSASQRILPLPEGRLSDVQTQMQLLQRLRSLIASPNDSTKSELPSSTAVPGIDDRQLAQLQQALKKLQEQLPPGLKPPDLDSIPKEQLVEAMSNPAMQQQLKKMLEQFSKDGLLPKDDGGPANSPVPPIPPRPGQPQPQPSGSQPSGTEPSGPQPSGTQPQPSGQPPMPQSEPPMPQSGLSSPPEQPREQSWDSLRNAMQKLAEIAQGGEGEPRENEVASSDRQQPSLQVFQDLLERYKEFQRNQPPSSDSSDSPESEENQPPEVRPGMWPPRSENDGSAPAANSSRGVIRRPDRAKSFEAPINSGPRTSERGEVFPPAEMPSSESPTAPVSNGGRRDQRTEQPSRNSAGPDSSGNSKPSVPSVSEFLKEQFRKGFPAPGTDDDVADSESPGSANRPGLLPPSDPERPDSARRGTPDATTGTEQSGVAIRSELQKLGVRGTIDRIIEDVKEESRAQRKAQQRAERNSLADRPGTEVDQSGSTGRPDAQTNSPGGKGMEKPFTDLRGGMDDKMEDLIRDAKLKDQSAEWRQPRDLTWQPSPHDSGSRTGKWNELASDFLSGLSKAPSAPSVSRSSSSGGGSVSGDIPLPIGSLFLIGVGLLGVMAIAAFMMRRPLLKLVSDATGIAGPGRIHESSEIRSREDVIRAFHELALNPRKPVESWWTHRAAATQLAAESPQQGNAVRTLAEIYEQARYLPDNVELSVDRIQSARTALAECR